MAIFYFVDLFFGSKKHNTVLNLTCYGSVMKLPMYGRFVWYLWGHHVKGTKPPEPKQRITVRLPQSIMKQRTQVYNTLKQRYGTRTVHSLGELDRETYCLGLSKVLETATQQATEEQRKQDQFNRSIGLIE